MVCFSITYIHVILFLKRARCFSRETLFEWKVCFCTLEIYLIMVHISLNKHIIYCIFSWNNHFRLPWNINVILYRVYRGKKLSLICYINYLTHTKKLYTDQEYSEMTIVYQITLGCSNIFIYLQSRFTALCFMTWLKMHFTYGYSRSLLIDTYSFYATICLRLTNCFVNNLTVMVLFIIKSFPDCYRCPTVTISYLKVTYSYSIYS